MSLDMDWLLRLAVIGWRTNSGGESIGSAVETASGGDLFLAGRRGGLH
jgi:hypothetical protein